MSNIKGIEWLGGAGAPLTPFARETIEVRRSGKSIEVADELVDQAFVAGKNWFAAHPDGASSDDEWRDHYRAVLYAVLNLGNRI